MRTLLVLLTLSLAACASDEAAAPAPLDPVGGALEDTVASPAPPLADPADLAPPVGRVDPPATPPLVPAPPPPPAETHTMEDGTSMDDEPTMEDGEPMSHDMSHDGDHDGGR